MKLLFALLFMFLISSQAVAQLGNRYFHTDTLNINATTARDTTWSDEWEVATITADTVDVDITIGAPDVGDWSNRKAFRLLQGMALTIGPTPKLKRLKAITTNGSGVLYIIGYKRVRQY